MPLVLLMSVTMSGRGDCALGDEYMSEYIIEGPCSIQDDINVLIPIYSRSFFKLFAVSMGKKIM